MKPKNLTSNSYRVVGALSAAVSGHCPPWVAMNHISDASQMIARMLRAGARDAIDEVLRAPRGPAYRKLALSILAHVLDYSPAGIVDDQPLYFQAFAMRCWLDRPVSPKLSISDIDRVALHVAPVFGSVQRPFCLSERLYPVEIAADYLALFRLRNALADRRNALPYCKDHLFPVVQYDEASSERLLIGIASIPASQVPSPPQAVIPMPSERTQLAGPLVQALSDALHLTDPALVKAVEEPVRLSAMTDHDSAIPLHTAEVIPLRPAFAGVAGG